MSRKDELYFSPEEYQVVHNVSKRFARSWKEMNYEDIYQELWLWMCEPKNYRFVMEYRNDANNNRLAKSLARAAGKYCEKETEEMYATKIKDSANNYNMDTVKEALPYVFVDDITKAWSNMNVETAFVALMDIHNAFHGLNKADKALLKLKYHDELTHAEIAEQLNITEEASTKRVHRVLLKLLTSLSGEPASWVNKSKLDNTYDEDMI